ncbi:MAG: SAM-dependent methyltransferase, partial [Alphaproteobacteria bacterium]
MTPLAEILARRIAMTGPITVAAFMAEALGHPRHGYYMTADPFGAAGDFVTAPEVSQMFGELIGLWVADVWQGLGAPAPFRLIELGPGRGTLMADLLRALAVVPE